MTLIGKFKVRKVPPVLFQASAHFQQIIIEVFKAFPLLLDI